jgi:hypothetical protein
LRILMVTDAWKPQINGVVHTLERLAETLTAFDAEADFLTPNIFRTLPMPTYPDIRLALTTPGNVARIIEERRPDHIHIVTEGPLGIMARRYCLARRPPLHHQLPHALSRICQRPPAPARELDLRLAAQLPQFRPGLHGRHPVARRRSGVARL